MPTSPGLVTGPPHRLYRVDVPVRVDGVFGVSSFAVIIEATCLPRLRRMPRERGHLWLPRVVTIAVRLAGRAR